MPGLRSARNSFADTQPARVRRGSVATKKIDFPRQRDRLLKLPCAEVAPRGPRAHAKSRRAGSSRAPRMMSNTGKSARVIREKEAWTSHTAPNRQRVQSDA